MRRVHRDEIVDYQTWADHRDTHLKEILPIKAARRIHVGPNLTFLFENADTVRYQVQEMMRVEQIVRDREIQHELDTYNELLGGDGELGAVLLIEIDSEAERAEKLVAWLDLPRHLYVVVDGGDRIYARFDQRQIGETRVSSVQYLKFDTGGRVPVAIGADHPELTIEVPLTAAQRAALEADLGSAPQTA